MRDDATYVVDTITSLRAEVERLREEVDALRLVATSYEPEALRLQAEVERLQELLRGTGANRYWEGRWRDEKADNERLRAVVREAEFLLTVAAVPDGHERCKMVLTVLRAALEPKP